MKNFPVGFPRRVIPVVAILALSGCSDLYVFGLFEDDTTAAQTAADAGVRSRAGTEQAKAEDGDTPSLRNVPLRPAPGSSAVRNRVVEGLISDRDNARYTDEAIRLQGSTRATVVPPPAPAVTVPTAPTPSAPIIAAAPARTYTPPAVIPRPAAPPQISAARSSPSVVVDMSALGGGGYSPVSAPISRESQVATIQFNHSSARLGARDQQLISTVASAYQQQGGTILVVGHSSSRTRQLAKSRHKVANFKVSFARANAVAQALFRAGVSSERVTVEAVADDQPVYSEAMPTGEAGNRRAEIFFLR
jgi:outer membrane protein OmpA-like peptidoglycan-associated protein